MEPKFKVGDNIVPSKVGVFGEGEIIRVDQFKYTIKWGDSVRIKRSTFENVDEYYRKLTPLEKALK